MTPLDRGGLTRSESDQDHLEFSHPFFVRDHPELLINIKRKQSTRSSDNSGMSVQTQANIQLVMDELRQMREKQRSMDSKMHELIKENESLWEHIGSQRAQHNRQQQVVTKLVQFLVAMVQPNLSKRVIKRGVLAIDEPPNKRARTNQSNNSNLTDILDRLQRELADNGGLRGGRGPIIADVTEEWTPKNQMEFGSAPSNSTNFDQNQASVHLSTSSSQNSHNIDSSSNLMQPSSSQASPTSFSPTITMSPSLERQISQELQEYLNGVDAGIDNCRDLLGGNWDFLDDLEDQQQHQGSSSSSQVPKHTTGMLALEEAPSSTGANTNNFSAHELDQITVENPMDPTLEFPITPTMGHVDLFPTTPELLTPCTSPHH
uniref:HSF_DOMAIN domain-containing protein n=1 Tax=Heterorhabditis bacteriophora TaxID=37862 RepID=A0A1I7XGW0_HETBA